MIWLAVFWLYCSYAAAAAADDDDDDDGALLALSTSSSDEADRLLVEEEILPDVSRNDEDYLDLRLDDEAIFLDEYKSRLASLQMMWIGPSLVALLNHQLVLSNNNK